MSVKMTEIPPLHKSNVKIGQKKKNHSKSIFFFRVLEINQRLAATWGGTIQEKQPNQSKNHELGAIKESPPHSSVHQSF